MTSFRLSACLLAAAAASAGGCLRVDDQSAQLTISLTFGNFATCALAGVDSLKVSSPSGQFTTQIVTCASQISITPLAPGKYRVEVDGLSASAETYTATDDVTLGATGSAITMNLSAVAAGGAANVIADFAFGAPTSATTAQLPNLGMSCAEAGASSVTVSIDGATPFVADCHDANHNRDSAVIQTTAGNHNFSWIAWSGTGGTGTQLYTTTEQSVPIAAGNGTEFTVFFAGVVTGGWSLAWTYNDVTAMPNALPMADCQQAGVVRVSVDVFDATDTEVGGFPITINCSGSMSDTVSSTGLTAGAYFVTLQAYDAADLNLPDGGSQNSMVVYQVTRYRLYAPAGVPKQPFTTAIQPTG